MRAGQGFVRDLIGSVLAIAVYCGVVAMAGYAAYGFVANLPARDEHAPAPATWHEQVAAQPSLALDMTDLVGGAPRYLVRRHPAGGRRDLIEWSASGGDADPAMIIEVYRPGGEIDERATKAVASAPAEGFKLPSKFGPFEVTPDRGSSVPGRRCVAFSRTDTAIRIAGRYCGDVKQPRAVEIVACALDRLTLVSAHGDARLAGIFARAQLKQSACGPGKLPAAAIPQRSAWIDAEGSPALRPSPLKGEKAQRSLGR